MSSDVRCVSGTPSPLHAAFLIAKVADRVVFEKLEQPLALSGGWRRTFQQSIETVYRLDEQPMLNINLFPSGGEAFIPGHHKRAS